MAFIRWIEFLLLIVTSCYVPVESVICRDTSVTANLSNPDIRHEMVGDVMTRFLRSSIAPRRSPLGDEVVEYIYRLYNETDSPRLKAHLQSFAMLNPVVVIWANPALGDFCRSGSEINQAALFVKDENNRGLIPLVDSLANIVEHNCKIHARLILDAMGCKKLPEIEPCYKGPVCSDGGFVYPIKVVLDTYGKHIPCRLRSYIIELYESHKIEDKVLATTLVLTMTDYAIAVENTFALDKRIEIANLLADPSEKKCCCKARRERLLQLCESLGDTNVDPIRNVFTTECPPEAAYQK